MIARPRRRSGDRRTRARPRADADLMIHQKPLPSQM
jgi:hypothetical protein